MRPISLSAILLALAVFVAASPSVDQDKRQLFPPHFFLVLTNSRLRFPAGEDLGERQSSSDICSPLLSPHWLALLSLQVNGRQIGDEKGLWNQS